MKSNRTVTAGKFSKPPVEPAKHSFGQSISADAPFPLEGCDSRGDVGLRLRIGFACGKLVLIRRTSASVRQRRSSRHTSRSFCKRELVTFFEAGSSQGIVRHVTMCNRATLLAVIPDAIGSIPAETFLMTRGPHRACARCTTPSPRVLACAGVLLLLVAVSSRAERPQHVEDRYDTVNHCWMSATVETHGSQTKTIAFWMCDQLRLSGISKPTAGLAGSGSARRIIGLHG